jgi:hypothetical protein
MLLLHVNSPGQIRSGPGNIWTVDFNPPKHYGGLTRHSSFAGQLTIVLCWVKRKSLSIKSGILQWLPPYVIGFSLCRWDLTLSKKGQRVHA